MIHRWMKSAVFVLGVVLGAALLLAGFGAKVQESSLIGKRYAYEKDGFGGRFTIQLKEDHAFSYFEGGLSSHFGAGTWSLDGDILTLSEPDLGYRTVKNRFKVDGVLLVFQAEGSDGFIHVEVADGEAFIALTEDEPPSRFSGKNTALPGDGKTESR